MANSYLLSMSHGPELERLALRWAAHPTSTCFAALAEGLRKSGALDEAESVAATGIRARPEYLPGHLVLARIYRDQQRWQPAELELRAALRLDGTHPVVIEALDQLIALDPPAEVPLVAGPEFPQVEPESDELPVEPVDLVYTDEIVDDGAGADDLVLTESLAMLYWSQGHLERAVEVFGVLTDRNPGHADLAARRDAARAELAAQRPRPYDARDSGGRPVREWLSALAAARPVPAVSASSLDAFYQHPAPAPADPGDLTAFKAWLQELHR